MKDFVAYASPLHDERGQSQVFCERLFQAFGHKGYLEAGATLEARVAKKTGKGKRFIDLLWKPVLLLEMKSAKEKLNLHYQQAFDYWITAVPNRPRYVVLCNFKEFWIYDFDKQLDEPVDKVDLTELPQRYTALNFLFPDNPKPVFGNDREAVSRVAADQMADLYRMLIGRGSKKISQEEAQRFVLQLLVAMFAEDVDLLPKNTVINIANDCVSNGQSSYDLFGGLFKQMNERTPAKGGRFVGIRYFNGGLFDKIQPIELRPAELALVAAEKTGVALKDWSKIHPAIFGTLFQDSMDKNKRHALGAHFTHESDIQRVVGPSIVRPWRARIDGATSMKQLLELRTALAQFRVLDPACGSGNFLYVAFREMARLDLRILQRLREMVSEKEFAKQVRSLALISPKQFFGIELDPFGAELAKVTLVLAKELALEEAKEMIELIQENLDLDDDSLPFENLDNNILCADALFCEWPSCEVILGNPPYQSKNKSQSEMEPGYIHELRARYPQVDGRADYCSYWFRLAHDHLRNGQRAGLVGTNTIRQNYSRMASLDYVTGNGGTITEAMSSMPWPGDANLHVSIVNWIKGPDDGLKSLFIEEGTRGKTKDRHERLHAIGPSLSFDLDLTKARDIKSNKIYGCYQGQTHGHKAFLMNKSEANLAISKDRTGKLAKYLRPFLIANDMLGKKDRKPTRYVVDFQSLDLLEAQKFVGVFEKIQASVLPKREAAAAKENQRNKIALKKNPQARVNKHHANFLKRWWVMSYPREDMMDAIAPLERYIVCGQVTKRPIFEFVSTSINPNAALMVFAYDDDYSFGILQSDMHWRWFINRCSTLTERYRYTSNTVWDSFPWPQSPSVNGVKKVAACGVALRKARATLMKKHGMSLRALYRSMDLPGDHPLKLVHNKLDVAVREAYGMTPKQDVLAFLLKLNLSVAQQESKGHAVQAPGIPDTFTKRSNLVSNDAVGA